jgi:hypothetical protein
LLKQGFDFHFVEFGNKCEAISPDGSMRFQVICGEDDILRIPHDLNQATSNRDIQTVSSVNLVTPNSVLAATRLNNNATAKWIHELLNHGSREICYQTLMHTYGYEAKRFPESYCSSCAQANARRRGISHKVAFIGNATISLDSFDLNYKDEESASDSDDDI